MRNVSRMVRKQVVIEVEQDRALAERSRILGVSQSELVRRAIDGLLRGPGEADTRATEWTEVEAVMRGAKGRFGGALDDSGNRTWNRGSLHER